MTIKTRIQFDGDRGRFYVQRKRWFLIIPYWSTVSKKGAWSSDDVPVRYFENYDDARTFCIKLAVDVVLEHKANDYGPLT